MIMDFLYFELGKSNETLIWLNACIQSKLTYVKHFKKCIMCKINIWKSIFKKENNESKSIFHNLRHIYTCRFNFLTHVFSISNTNISKPNLVYGNQKQPWFGPDGHMCSYLSKWGVITRLYKWSFRLTGKAKDTVEELVTDSPVLKLVTSTFNHLTNPYQQLLIPITIWSGLQAGFFGADFTAVNMFSFLLLEEILLSSF